MLKFGLFKIHFILQFQFLHDWAFLVECWIFDIVRNQYESY